MNRNQTLILVLLLGSTANGADEPIGFRRDIAPLLVKRCISCHSERKPQGGLSMKTFADLKRGGKTNGAEILVVGKPEESGLIESLQEDAKPRMPYKQPMLSEQERATFTRWIQEGAKFDGPSETETVISSLVDVSANLPKIPSRVQASDPVTSIAISPDGKTAAAAIGAKIVLFDLYEDEIKSRFGDHPGPISTVLFTADGKRLIAAGGRPGQFGAISVWDIDSKQKLMELRGHSDAILSADLSPDSSLLVTGSYDRLVKVWNLAQGVEVRTLKEHTDAVHSVAFSPDGKLIASASADRTIKIWNASTGEKRLTLGESTAEVYAVIFGTDNKSILSAGADRLIRSWELNGDSARLVRTAFAHEAAIVRLVSSKDRKFFVSSGEDNAVKFWDSSSLRPLRALEAQSDWPLGLALSPDGFKLLVGSYDGSINLHNVSDGKRLAELQGIGGRSPMRPVRLVGPPSLNPITPRSLVRGQTLKVTLSGTGMGEAIDSVIQEQGLSSKIMRRDRPEGSSIEAELAVSNDARIGVHTIAIRTRLGTTPAQPILISDEPEALEKEPNGLPQIANAITFPATIAGTMEKPGDNDLFLFQAKQGQELVFEVYARTIGSPLNCGLTILSTNGQTITSAASPGGKADPKLVWKAPGDGSYLLRVEDVDLGGSSNHVYRIRAGELPFVSSVFPLGIDRSRSESVKIHGSHLPSEPISIFPADMPAIGEISIASPLARNIPSLAGLRLYVGQGKQVEESKTKNDGPHSAELIEMPGGVSASIDEPGDTDLFRFQAIKGHPIVVETHAQRLGSPVDTAIEILDDKLSPVASAVLRPIEETHVAFRDHASTSKSIRLTEWERFREGDYVFCGRELMKLEDLPRNPDDDAVFWGTGGTRKDPGERMAFLGTTPEHHTLNQPLYKVEIHPPGTTFPKSGVAPKTLFYRNDDGGPGIGKDSYLAFNPPQTGTYFVRVQDVGGQGGFDYGYHLQIREPQPDFRLSVNIENPNIPRGGTLIVQVNAARLDGFNGPIDVGIVDLPEGITAEPCRIEQDGFTASILLTASATAERFTPASWKLVGTSSGQSHTFDPAGPRSGFITVRPEPPLKIRSSAQELTIHPGERIELTLAVDRAEGFQGRVPIDVRNLPRGVKVLNIGLNGVLVTEKQTERSIFLYAEPSAELGRRSFYAVGNCEQTGTEHSSSPIRLLVASPISTGSVAPSSR